MFRRLENILIHNRLWLIIGFNALLTTFGYIAALCLRFDFNWEEVLPSNRLWLPLALLITCRYASYLYFRLHQGYWKYVSTHDALKLLSAHFLSSLAFAALILLLRVEGFPRSVIFIELMLSILLSGGTRLSTRILSERIFSKQLHEYQTESRQVIVIGAGDSGHLLVKNMLAHRRLSYQPVAVLDDSERLIGSSVFGIPVYGSVAMLENCLADYPRVSAVIVAIPSLSHKRKQQIEQVCKKIGVPLKKLQAFEDLACIDATSRQDGITIEAVLEKEVHVEHEEEILSELQGRVVMVTGAGGSIGSELVRQIMPFKPKAVLLFDNSEYNLFALNRGLNGGYPEVQRHLLIGSIKDRTRLMRIFDEHRPEVVFHAAAYKHVPLMEDNPYEAFCNNVLGTRNVLDAALQYGAKRFVMISSDKAVEPTSVMGCSKLIAEMLVQQYAQAADATQSKHPMSTAVVRFGNVINSTGSVIPIFKEQILSGGPVTVTHPLMERYFMSIREAVRLVLTAGTLGERGEIYILDMGKPIKVVDVAKKMLALYGRRDIEIVFTGIRPGEKLSEELLMSTEFRGPTRFKKVNRVKNFKQPPIELSLWINALEARLTDIRNSEIRGLMFELVSSVQQASIEAPEAARA